MELTQEYLDKGLANQLEATNENLKKAAAPLVTKQELSVQLETQTAELKQYTNDAFEAQQVWMDERFKELIVKYDVRERVEKLEKEFREFKFRKTVHA